MDPNMDPNVQGGQPVPSQKVDGHTGRDALLGGIAGHETGHGHTVRDAVVGGAIGHEGKEHREHQAEQGKTGLMDKIKDKF